MPQEVAVLIRHRSPRVRRSVVAAAVAAAALALGACESGGDNGTDAAKADTGKGAGVVAPGKPGEPAKTLSAEEALKAAPDNTPNSADFTYAQMMIVHHGQALDMTALVPERAGSEQVKRLASRIADAQKPEIGMMEAWLKNNGGAKKHAGHDHGTMPGMATEAQLTQLRAAKGKAFDELFLKLMITHHQGAITMATEALSEGNNVQVEEMANDVISQQTSEMNRMRAM
ncbi:DUF305 domain-containing protein [Streptomyces sp. L-9-10]|uniref:DUF305 domain-containing protein n=1 Tax=Streptomyces sp. L-9-10 TaxID=1478131 RepID=UPI00101CBA7A|nr:DUF305 domain-containing protein [Streptomyces sp. L-9-10]